MHVRRLRTVLHKLDSFLQVRKNVIFERAWFNRQNWSEAESLQEYITYLYNLVNNCKHGELKSEMICEWLVEVFINGRSADTRDGKDKRPTAQSCSGATVYSTSQGQV